ncbi:uncharacterized protein LOC144452787 [Glandiceps talaboti]
MNSSDSDNEHSSEFQTKLLGLCAMLYQRIQRLEKVMECSGTSYNGLFLEDIGETSTDEKFETSMENDFDDGIPPPPDHIPPPPPMPPPSPPVSVAKLNGTVLEGQDESTESSTDDSQTVYVRVSIPELNLQKCVCFHLDKTVWTAKQQLLLTLPRELQDGGNYGLYLPPESGKAGKFLDEERLVKDYPLSGPIGFLEFKYKRKVYKQLKLDKSQIRRLHTKANLKNFMDFVKAGSVDKVSKLLDKGLDPNYQDDKTGETPLSVAVTIDKSHPLIPVLVNGGAHLDYRGLDGMTPLHKAAKKANCKGLKVMLDLGASPNHKDNKRLTPLYYTMLYGGNAQCAQLLLHDRADVNVTDDRGWTEIHQACRYGRVQHLELLLYYKADMNIQNEAGNTALHICALYNQEACARVVLFRGANKDTKNYANQTAFQVAIVANNFEMAEMIRNHKVQDVVPFQDLPKYNVHRRPLSSYSAMHRTWSDTHLQHENAKTVLTNNGSLRSLPPQSIFTKNTSQTAVSLPRKTEGIVSPGSHASSTYTLPRSNKIAHSVNTGDMMKHKPYSVAATCTLPRTKDIKKCIESSRVMAHRKLYECLPGRVYIAIKNYTGQEAGELTLHEGDCVEVLSIGEHNYWEGKVRDTTGWFPSYCVEEVKMREKKNKGSIRRKDDVIVVKSHPMSLLAEPPKMIENDIRCVVLEKSKKGYGFVLRGAKSYTNDTNGTFEPSTQFPALQYLDSVDKGGVAHKAGLQAGDFILEINGENVIYATHRQVVDLVRKSGDTLRLKVATVIVKRPYTWTDGNRKNFSLCSSDAPKPPQRSAETRLSTNVTMGPDELEALEELDDAIRRHSSVSDLSASSNAGRLASIKARPTSKRLSQAEIYEIFKRQGSTEDITPGSTNTTKPVIPGPVSVKSSPNACHGSLRSALSTPNLVMSSHHGVYQRRTSSPSGTVKSDSHYRPSIGQPVLVDSTSEQEEVRESISEYRRSCSMSGSESTASSPSTMETASFTYHLPSVDDSTDDVDARSDYRKSSLHHSTIEGAISQSPTKNSKIPSSFNPDNAAKFHMLPPPISQHGIRTKLKQHQRTNSLTDRCTNPMPATQPVQILPQPDYMDVWIKGNKEVKGQSAEVKGHTEEVNRGEASSSAGHGGYLTAAVEKAALERQQSTERCSSDLQLSSDTHKENDSMTALHLALAAKERSLKESSKTELVESVDPSTALKIAVERRRIEIETDGYRGSNIDDKIQKYKRGDVKIDKNEKKEDTGVALRGEIQLAAAAMQQRLATKTPTKRNYVIPSKSAATTPNVNNSQKTVVIINPSQNKMKKDDMSDKKAAQNARLKASLQSKKTILVNKDMKSSALTQVSETESDLPTFLPPPPIDTDFDTVNNHSMIMPETLPPPPAEFSNLNDNTVGKTQKDHIPNRFMDGKYLTEEEKNRMNQQRILSQDMNYDNHKPGFNSIRKKFEMTQKGKPTVDKTFERSSKVIGMPVEPCQLPPPPVLFDDDRVVSLSPHRERNFDTASTVSSISTLSTLSSLSAVSGDNSDSCATILEDDESTDTLKSNRSVLSQNTSNNQHSLFGGAVHGPHDDFRVSTPPPPSEFSDTAYSSANSEAGGSEDGRDQWNFHSAPHGVRSDHRGYQDKIVDEWNVHDVAEWLQSINMSEYKQAFIDNEISGEHLSALTKEEFIELGITRIGHRMTIDRALKKVLQSF